MSDQVAPHQEDNLDERIPSRSRKSASDRDGEKHSLRTKRSVKTKDTTASYYKFVKKVDRLADMIGQSKHTVLYSSEVLTGANRGGRGFRSADDLCDKILRTREYATTTLSALSEIEPTYIHMAIKELTTIGLVKHVITAGVDALYLRAGVKQNQLSEIFGNAYIQICDNCGRQYFREPDSVERVYNFGRKCHFCTEFPRLYETISEFIDQDRTEMPVNWPGAKQACSQAELIICIGNNFEPLFNHRHVLLPEDVELVLIDHETLDREWKDRASLTIKAKYRRVFKELMRSLDIKVPAYDWRIDPLVAMAASFHDREKNLNGNILLNLDATVPANQQAPMPNTDTESISDRSPSNSRKHKFGDSTNVFISEVTDDPEGKHLKMRIRLNADSDTLSSSKSDCDK